MPNNPTSEWAIKACAHVTFKPQTYGEAARAHARCNFLLTQLRSGSRRRRYWNVRHSLRKYRAKLAKRWRFPKGRYAA